MEKRFDMKTIKQKHLSGYALIEVMIVLLITLWSTLIIVPSSIKSDIHRFDAQVFTTMMKAIHTNTSQPIVMYGTQINVYHPTHAFSKSYSYNIESLEITFYIGRGYYAIKKRP